MACTPRVGPAEPIRETFFRVMVSSALSISPWTVRSSFWRCHPQYAEPSYSITSLKFFVSSAMRLYINSTVDREMKDNAVESTIAAEASSVVAAKLGGKDVYGGRGGKREKNHPHF